MDVCAESCSIAALDICSAAEMPCITLLPCNARPSYAAVVYVSLSNTLFVGVLCVLLVQDSTLRNHCALAVLST
jgi:hypothetical protein